MPTTPVICLMGPTATGKTEIALRLAERFPVDLVSVDSALVYRGMDIGTAKPGSETLARYPHRLIDIREPEEPYSAGDFVRDALAAIREARDKGRLPLLVGGTMLYFRALTRGIAELPAANAALRRQLDDAAAQRGWPALHRELAAVDPLAADRIDRNDGQRIQRALEVFRLSGRSLSDWQRETSPAADLEFLRIGLLPTQRAVLHERIEARLDAMLSAGFVAEVRQLRRRPGLTSASPAMRAVGYRQLWAHLAGECDLPEARQRALAATRQLAKRQMTWLRAEPLLNCVNPLEAGSFDAILSLIGAVND